MICGYAGQGGAGEGFLGGVVCLALKEEAY